MSRKAHARIDNWAIGTYWKDAYKAPEQRRIVLQGTISRHPVEDSNGEGAVTSAVLWYSSEAGFAETQNTLYVLGTPDPEWVEWLQKEGLTPDSFNRTYQPN